MFAKISRGRFFCFVLFLWYWDWNIGLCTYYTSTLSVEPGLQPRRNIKSKFDVANL
jgi:hypothetical protein